jgi:hypothetical protein
MLPAKIRACMQAPRQDIYFYDLKLMRQLMMKGGIPSRLKQGCPPNHKSHNAFSQFTIDIFNQLVL